MGFEANVMNVFDPFLTVFKWTSYRLRVLVARQTFGYVVSSMWSIVAGGRQCCSMRDRTRKEDMEAAKRAALTGRPPQRELQQRPETPEAARAVGAPGFQLVFNGFSGFSMVFKGFALVFGCLRPVQSRFRGFEGSN